MSIEVLKRELSALDPGTQRQVMTFLVSLADQREVAFRLDYLPSPFPKPTAV